jgi:hypothetical protein
MTTFARILLALKLWRAHRLACWHAHEAVSHDAAKITHRRAGAFHRAKAQHYQAEAQRIRHQLHATAGGKVVA